MADQAVDRAPHDDVAVSVLVPVLNEERHIVQSVAAIQSYRFAGRIELIFVDGGSSDRSREILESLSAGDDRIRVLDNLRRASTSGLNVALAQARMDVHTVYPDDHVAVGVRRIEQGGIRSVSAHGSQVSWRTGGGAGRRDRVSQAVALALGSPLGRVRGR